MTYFAEIKDGKVIQVIVATQKVIDTLEGDWVETKIDHSIRKNYAGIGYTLDGDDDFVPLEPILENSDDYEAVLDSKTKQWIIQDKITKEEIIWTL